MAVIVKPEVVLSIGHRLLRKLPLREPRLCVLSIDLERRPEFAGCPAGLPLCGKADAEVVVAFGDPQPEIDQCLKMLFGFRGRSRAQSD